MYTINIIRKRDNKSYNATFDTASEARAWKASQLAKGDRCPFGKPEHEKNLKPEDVPQNAELLEVLVSYEPRLDVQFNPIFDEQGNAILDEIVVHRVKIPAEFTIEEYETEFNHNQLELAYVSLRNKRDMYLKETDFTQLADAPFNSEEKAQYRAYRAFLRGLPQQHNDSTILNATVPTFEQYLDSIQ